MYNLVIKDDLDIENPYYNAIVLHDLTMEEAGEFIKKISEKDDYYFEIIKQKEE